MDLRNLGRDDRMKKTSYEMNRDHIKRTIENLKKDLGELGSDLAMAKSWKTKDFIEREVDQIKKRIDRKEFELWKMHRGDEQ